MTLPEMVAALERALKTTGHECEPAAWHWLVEYGPELARMLKGAQEAWQHRLMREDLVGQPIILWRQARDPLGNLCERVYIVPAEEEK